MGLEFKSLSALTEYVAQCFIRYKRTKEFPGSNPTELVFPLFLKWCISTQQPGPKQNPLKNLSTSYLYCIKMIFAIPPIICTLRPLVAQIGGHTVGRANRSPLRIWLVLPLSTRIELCGRILR